MWLIVGLGNPGKEHALNRHNVGFMAVDEIAAHYNFPAFRSKFEGEISEGRIAGEKVVLLKPMTYMNESGQSVGKAVKFFKVPADKMVVFYDELDLTPGKIKIKQGGGTAGHNGLKSLDRHCPDKNYWKIRLGIGHPGDRNRVTGYVLSDFSKTEQKWLEPWIGSISDHVPLLLQDNHSDYMTRIAEEGKNYGI